MSQASVQQPEPVASLYAKALFELATERGEVEAVQADLAGLVEMLEQSKDLDNALAGFGINSEARTKFINEFADKTQLNSLLTRFINLLVQKNRGSVLNEVFWAYRTLVDQSKNIVRGTVTTVEPMTEVEVTDLSKAFARKINKQVVLDPVIDKEILGGLVVKIQGLTFDGSLKTTIRRLKENLERQSI